LVPLEKSDGIRDFDAPLELLDDEELDDDSPAEDSLDDEEPESEELLPHARRNNDADTIATNLNKFSIICLLFSLLSQR